VRGSTWGPPEIGIGAGTERPTSTGLEVKRLESRRGGGAEED
jgi:hypothetical protein